MPRLDFYANYKLLVKVRLRNPEILIGRGADCDIQLADELVSRHHAKIEEKGGEHFLSNLSPNGTRVNHALVEKPQKLAPGDRIYIEKTVVIYQPDEAPAAFLEQSRTQLKVPMVKMPKDSATQE